jgi:hypothetical protein
MLVNWLIGASLLKAAVLADSLPGVQGSVCWPGDGGAVILPTFMMGRSSVQPTVKHASPRIERVFYLVLATSPNSDRFHYGRIAGLAKRIGEYAAGNAAR